MKRVAVALLSLALVQAARAQGVDMSKGGGPVEVTSDNGMEWRQNEQIIVASGNARAVRGDVTVTADRLIAHYRKKTPPQGSPAPAGPPPQPAPGSAPSVMPDTGDNEVYRLEAEGNVHIFNPTDQAFGDKAVYDIDQAVLVMTGHDLHIITPQDLMRARDVMEYWSQKHMAVGRGDATVDTSDGRHLRGDVLVGYTADPNATPGGQKPAPAAVKTVAAATGTGGSGPNSGTAPGKPANDPLGASGKLQRVDAFGHVEVRTATEIIHADKGVYVPDTQIARMAGNVHITRGENQLNGDYAVVNLRTGVSTLNRNPGSRVEGLVVPNDANSSKPGDAKPGDAKPGDAKPATKGPTP